jgi:hypothetical protein
MQQEHEGAGRRGEEPTPSQAGRPEQQTPQQRGEGIRGIPPPPQGEQGKPQQERGKREPLPSVWDVLERDVRLSERYDKDDLTRQEYEEGEREQGEVKRLANAIREKGTVRDRLILDLYSTITLEPSGLPVLIPYNRSLKREEYQQFRSKVEPLSEEKLAEEIRKAKEDFKRREDAHPGRRPPPPELPIRV